MTTVTISLPETLKAFIDQQVATKGYGNVSEYFRSLLREAQERYEEAGLEVLLREGLATGGKDIPLTRAFRRASRLRLWASRGSTNAGRRVPQWPSASERFEASSVPVGVSKGGERCLDRDRFYLTRGACSSATCNRIIPN